MSRSLCQLSYSPILLAGATRIEHVQQVLGTRSPTLEHSPLHLISSIQSSLTVKVSLETNRLISIHTVFFNSKSCGGGRGLISIHTTVYGGKVAGTAGIEPTFRESKSRVLAVTLHPFNKKKKNKIGVGAELRRLMLVIRVKVVGIYRYTDNALYLIAPAPLFFR